MFALLIDALESKGNTSHNQGFQIFAPGSILSRPLTSSQASIGKQLTDYFDLIIKGTILI